MYQLTLDTFKKKYIQKIHFTLQHQHLKQNIKISSTSRGQRLFRTNTFSQRSLTAYNKI